jgi:hypothetical protein
MENERAELFDSLRRYELTQSVSNDVALCIRALRDALLTEECDDAPQSELVAA